MMAAGESAVSSDANVRAIWALPPFQRYLQAQVFALHPTQLAKLLGEAGHVGLQRQLVAIAVHQHADKPLRLGVRLAERHHCRRAESCDEFAPPA